MANSVRILAVSDRVLDRLYTSNVRELVSDVDLIIGCGDLPYYYLDFLISALDVPLSIYTATMMADRNIRQTGVY